MICKFQTYYKWSFCFCLELTLEKWSNKNLLKSRKVWISWLFAMLTKQTRLRAENYLPDFLKESLRKGKKQSSISQLFVYSANLYVIKLCIDAPMKIYDFQWSCTGCYLLYSFTLINAENIMDLREDKCLFNKTNWLPQKSMYFHIDEFISSGIFYLKTNQHTFILGLKISFVRAAQQQESIQPLVL